MSDELVYDIFGKDILYKIKQLEIKNNQKDTELIPIKLNKTLKKTKKGYIPKKYPGKLKGKGGKRRKKRKKTKKRYKRRKTRKKRKINKKNYR
tara:strand:+ start:277 stop:555 length:279 start_codon:yes stop_codon:yes gene_type:complete